MIRFLTICATVTLASGCVISRAVYEESWAKQVQVESGACPTIDGEFRNAGEQGISAKEKAKCPTCGQIRARSLARLLNVGHDYEFRDDEVRFEPSIDDTATYVYQSIRLRLMDNSLQVEASLPDGSTESFELPTRRKCRNSTMVLNSSWDGTDIMGTVPFVSFVNHSSLALGRAMDGSLLVRRGSTEGMFLLEWPLMFGTEADWTRFAPITPFSEPLQAYTP